MQAFITAFRPTALPLGFLALQLGMENEREAAHYAEEQEKRVAAAVSAASGTAATAPPSRPVANAVVIVDWVESMLITRLCTLRPATLAASTAYRE